MWWKTVQSFETIKNEITEETFIQDTRCIDLLSLLSSKCNTTLIPVKSELSIKHEPDSIYDDEASSSSNQSSLVSSSKSKKNSRKKNPDYSKRVTLRLCRDCIKQEEEIKVGM